MKRPQTTVTIHTEYLPKLHKLSALEHRSATEELEYLIEQRMVVLRIIGEIDNGYRDETDGDD